jgi:hypothetical protein
MVVVSAGVVCAVGVGYLLAGESGHGAAKVVAAGVGVASAARLCDLQSHDFPNSPNGAKFTVPPGMLPTTRSLWGERPDVAVNNTVYALVSASTT